MTGTSRVLLTVAFVLVSARLLAGDGLGRVTYRITYADGQVEMREAATERQTDGAYRARFRHEHVELAHEVFATRYENGEELVTNYSAAPFVYRGREVRPETYEFYSK